MRSWAVLALGSALALPAAPALSAPGLEAYGRLPSLDEVTLSPDGAHLAYAVSNSRGRSVVVQRLSDDKIMATLQAGNNKVRWLDWAGPSHLLITLSKTALLEDRVGRSTVLGGISEYFTVQDYDLARNKMRAPLDSAQLAFNFVAGRPVIRNVQGRPIAYLKGASFATSDLGHARPTLYRADLDAQSLLKVETGGSTTEGWLLDLQGRPVVQVDYYAPTGRYALSLRQGDRWVERHAETAPLDTPALAGFGPTADTAIVRAHRDGRPALFTISLKDGGWSAPLGTSAEDGLLHDPVSKLLIGRVHVGESHSEYVFTDPVDQKAWDKVVRAFEGEEVRLASWSNDRSKVVVKVEGARDGAAFALVNLATGKVDWLGDEHEGITDKDVAPVKAAAYQAGDGRRIPAYLTLPPERDAKGLPLVVLPHGGPASRDNPGFDWWAQALASRGYAVLQPEFRGSEGFGAEHLQAGYGQWGRKMQTDLSDGVRYLSEEGVVDPKRVCIVGASYGGYAALAGAALDPGVYRCAASIAGPADLKRLVGHSSGRDLSSKSYATRYWARYMGVKDGNDPALEALSPASHAEKISVPVLLIHGEDDTVVPYEQSLIMQRALQHAGKPVELVTLKGEDHWLSSGETRLQMLTALVRFLETANPPT